MTFNSQGRWVNPAKIGLWLFICFCVIGILLGPINPYSIAEIRYLAAGIHLANGKGLVIPSSLNWGTNGTLQTFTHGPPLLAIWIAISQTFGISWSLSIKILNILSLLGTLWLSYLIMVRLTGKQMLAFVTSLAVFSMPSISEHFLTMNTEAPFIPIILLNVYLLIAYLDNPTKLFLMLISIVGAFAFLTRYAAMPLLVSSGLIILCHRLKTSIRTGFIDSYTYIVIAGFPTTIFLIINSLSSGEIGTRTFSYHPMTSNETMHILRLAIAGGVLGLAVFCLARRSLLTSSVQQIIKCSVIFVECYMMFIAFTATFFDDATPIDHRILSPIYFVFPMLLSLHICTGKYMQRYVLKTSSLIIMACIAVYMLLPFIQVNFSKIQHFTSTWDLVIEAQFRTDGGLPTDLIIYSDEPGEVYLTYVQEPFAVPLRYNPFSGEENSCLRIDIDVMRNHLKQCEAIFIYYGSWRDYLLNGTALLEELSLDLVEHHTDDMTVYYDSSCSLPL